MLCGSWTLSGECGGERIRQTRVVAQHASATGILDVLQIPSLVRIATINRVPVLLHWSVILLAVFYLVANVDRPSYVLVAIPSYLLVLVVHELGHQFVAHHCGYRVFAVEIYPHHGLCRFEHPQTRLDHAKIAWGGVLGQFLLAAPVIVRVVLWNYSSFGPL